MNTTSCEDLDIDQMDSDLSQRDFAETIILDDEIDFIGDSSAHNLGVEGAKTDGVSLQDTDMVEKPDSLADEKGGGSSSGKDEVSELENNIVATRVDENFMENAEEELKNSGLERTLGVT